MPSKAVTHLAIALCAIPIAAMPQTGHEEIFVYVVTIPATDHHKMVIQTGFRLRGTKGIITALHGVVDGKEFSAKNEQGDVLNRLTIASVDIADDLAVLRSKELENRPEEGLNPGQNQPPAGARLRVLGHPGGINLYAKTAYVGDPVLKALHTLLFGPIAEALNARASPSDQINVLNVEGNLVPGDSGAPVLDSGNGVVGVVDGGLQGGLAGISWAIPIYDVLNTDRWQLASSASSRLGDLAKMDVSNLFALEVVDDSPPTPANDVNKAKADEAYGDMVFAEAVNDRWCQITHCESDHPDYMKSLPGETQRHWNLAQQSWRQASQEASDPVQITRLTHKLSSDTGLRCGDDVDTGPSLCDVTDSNQFCLNSENEGHDLCVPKFSF